MWSIGIDVAKANFDVAVMDEAGNEHYEQFNNAPSGYKALSQWLTKQGVNNQEQVVMEATNVYWEALAEYLHEAGYKVSVVNPAVIKGFAQSKLSRHKTDKKDSWLAALYGQESQPAQWQPPQAHQKQLRSLVRHREALKKTRTQHLNRLAVTAEAWVRDSLQALITALDEQLDQTKEKIAALIQEHDDFKGNNQLLQSIPGIGPETASMIQAEFYDLEKYDSAASVAADAGVTPSHYESGTSVKRRSKMSRIGKAAVRGSLFLPVRSAMRFNPLVKALAQRLQQRGKHYMTIVTACTRKLLHIVFGVIKHQRPFDPNIMSTKWPVST